MFFLLSWVFDYRAECHACFWRRAINFDSSGVTVFVRNVAWALITFRQSCRRRSWRNLVIAEVCFTALYITLRPKYLAIAWGRCAVCCRSASFKIRLKREVTNVGWFYSGWYARLRPRRASDFGFGTLTVLEGEDTLTTVTIKAINWNKWKGKNAVSPYQLGLETNHKLRLLIVTEDEKKKKKTQKFEILSYLTARKLEMLKPNCELPTSCFVYFS